MKKILLAGIFTTLLNITYAQNGLEQVLVETYYVSDANDTTANADGGILPVGSVTYRIWADMLPGYRFQAVYGVPGHECRIATTTLFFNNEDRGATSPTYTKNQAANNTVMLDSWLSVGAACNGQVAVMKADDDGVSTVVNADGVLQNNHPDAGIPLSQQDGMIAGTPEPVTIVGINTEVTVFDNQNDGTNGPIFTTLNGSWASLNGSVGADTVTNKVLIAQITTDGTLTFELNIQIGTPSQGVENYVAQNPVGTEIQIPSLMYTSTGVGIKENQKTAFSLFPNPASERLFIRMNDNSAAKFNSFRVSDITGRIAISGKLELPHGNVQSINVGNLTPGIYLLEVVDGVKSSVKRFTVQ